MTELRYELAVSRIREMMDEETVEEKFRDYFRTVGAFVLLIDETNQKLRSGSFEKIFHGRTCSVECEAI